MMTTRFFEWFQFGVLACLGLLGVTRMIWLRARGVRVLVADRQRTGFQMLADLLMLVCLLVWAYELVAYAWGVRFHVWPTRLFLDGLAVRLAGVALEVAGLLIYGVAVRDLGESWRLGTDRDRPGPLVTGGIYARMRHPIYVGFDLLFVGTCLVLQRFVFLFLALAMAPLLHTVMLREERFLTELYGDAYRDYCSRIGRYFSL